MDYTTNVDEAKIMAFINAHYRYEGAKCFWGSENLEVTFYDHLQESTGYIGIPRSSEVKAVVPFNLVLDALNDWAHRQGKDEGFIQGNAQAILRKSK